jgi:hypothetical protein
MKFYHHENHTTLKEILIELTKQYHDNFQHLGVDEFSEIIQPNIKLLLTVIEELKDDKELELEYKFTKSEKELEI